MHLTRLDDDANWISYGPAARSSGAAKPAANGRKPAQKSPDPGTAKQTDDVHEDDVPPASTTPPGTTPLMLFPFPLRDTVDVWLTLPRDLTKGEADRLSVFIGRLARNDAGGMESSSADG